MSSQAEYVVDERVCKHWAIAGAMKGFVSTWDLQLSIWPNVGPCCILSLHTVTCCSSNF
jgi:hypothetical protein